MTNSFVIDPFTGKDYFLDLEACTAYLKAMITIYNDFYAKTDSDRWITEEFEILAQQGNEIKSIDYTVTVIQ